MKTLIVIPARYASSRYPGKPLVKLAGADGKAKSLIQRSWDVAMSVRGVEKVVVATDDARIRAVSEEFGAEVVMTSPDCANGTERCAETHAALGGGFDMVVNLQGDAPLTPKWFIEDLIESLAMHPEFDVATPVLRCDGRALAGLLGDRKAGRVGGTTAVFGPGKQALYFSKEVIPFVDRDFASEEETPVFHHVGAYAFRPQALAAYPAWQCGVLERLEGLEQLRFLEHGRAILCVQVDARGRQFWELNNPEDVARIEACLAMSGME